MSYRTFKHLLGETSLERKCRFIFGGGIFALVTTSFYLYGQKTEALLRGQITQTARSLVNPTIKDKHYKSHNFVNHDTARLFDQLAESFKRQDDLPEYNGRILDPYDPKKNKEANLPAASEKEALEFARFENDALEHFLRAASGGGESSKKPYTFSDGSSREESRTLPGKTKYLYAQAVLYKQECINCHNNTGYGYRTLASGKSVEIKLNDLACVAAIRLPLDQINRDINQNRAILISAALVTAIVAMFASYAIVRYVIVKPVKHLRDVSDAIAAGKLNIRAQIQTGDEFEELSHAFNRMLHNLVAMQQELRDVNHDLDRKVDELAQANLALFEMNRLKSDFLATMSHELRTPLNSIIGFSEVLSGSDTLNDRQKRYAANIQTSGKMLLGMINDILDLAKIESGKMEVQTEDFSIRDVCEALTALARPIADRKNIDLECRLDEAIPLLRQDPGKLRQILYNLLSNAIKFTPDGGRVSLKAHVEGRMVVLSVADTGIGIAEEDREKIFEKFRQAGHPGQGDVLTREHQGTGLGLSIVRELAKLLGGDVHLESRPGQGSTFTVKIPMQLPGNRKFEVNLSDERIDLTKARRVDARVSMSPLGLVATEAGKGS